MVKFKTYENEMTDGREIMNNATREQSKQMPDGEERCRRNVKMTFMFFMSKLEAAISLGT